jgi:hypothetical protein
LSFSLHQVSKIFEKSFFGEFFSFRSNPNLIDADYDTSRVNVDDDSSRLVAGPPGVKRRRDPKRVKLVALLDGRGLGILFFCTETGGYESAASYGLQKQFMEAEIRDFRGPRRLVWGAPRARLVIGWLPRGRAPPLSSHEEPGARSNRKEYRGRQPKHSRSTGYSPDRLKGCRE